MGSGSSTAGKGIQKSKSPVLPLSEIPEQDDNSVKTWLRDHRSFNVPIDILKDLIFNNLESLYECLCDSDDDYIDEFSRALPESVIRTWGTRNPTLYSNIFTDIQRKQADSITFENIPPALHEDHFLTVSEEEDADSSNPTRTIMRHLSVSNTERMKLRPRSVLMADNRSKIMVRSCKELNRWSEAFVSLKRKELEYLSEQSKDALISLSHDLFNSLDLNQLAGKILRVSCDIINCERSTLFLVDKDNNQLYSAVLESGPNDKECNESFNEIRFPIGVGVAGTVAALKIPLNIPNAYKDSRFNQNIDKETGYHTRNILAMPIKDQSGDLVGVAQLMNKIDGAFLPEDQLIFSELLILCGIAIRNAQLYEEATRQSNANHVLVDLIKCMFEPISVDELMEVIMERARVLVNADRCSLFLCNHAEKILTATVFVTELYGVDEHGESVVMKSTNHLEAKEIRLPMDRGIAGHVATTGETLNIKNAYTDSRFNRDMDDKTGYRTQSLLCMPIRGQDIDEENIVGVCQLVNKLKGFFTEEDEVLFEAFAVYASIALQKAQLYESAVNAEKKARVCLELISYHAQANINEIMDYIEITPNKDDFVDLDKFIFNPHSVDDAESVTAVLAMCIDLGIPRRFNISPKRLTAFVLTVRKNYRDVPYHNWLHAFNVSNFMFALIRQTDLSNYLSSLELFGLFISCLCHDVDHRGTDNVFQSNVNSPLSQLYGTSVLEQHHFSHTITILNDLGCNIFEKLAPNEYSTMLEYLEHDILATDLANHFAVRKEMNEILKEGPRLSPKNTRHRHLLRSLCMTCSDLSIVSKDFDVSLPSIVAVFTEFFCQGDLEREMGQDFSTPLMDRSNKYKLAELQVTFNNVIVLPAFQLLATQLPTVQDPCDRILSNLERWKEYNNNREKLSELVEKFDFRDRRSEMRRMKSMMIHAANSAPKSIGSENMVSFY